MMENKEILLDSDTVRENRRRNLIEKNTGFDQMGTFSLMRADLKIWGSISIALTKLGFYASIFYRLSRSMVKHRLFFIGRCIQFLSTVITGAEISNKAIIGPGLKILHPTGVHLGPDVILGARAVICDSSSIVTNREPDGREKQVIGDSLWLSAGGRIMGNVLLGDKVWVGPNSVVLKDVESEMTAFGIPARIFPEVFRFRFKEKDKGD